MRPRIGGRALCYAAAGLNPPARRARRRRRRRCCTDATTPAADRRAAPRRCPPARAARHRRRVGPTRSRCSTAPSPRPARKRLARATSCSYTAAMPIRLSNSRAGLRADPREPRRRGVEPAGVGGQPQRRAEVAGVHVGAGVPARGVRDDVGLPLVGDRHPGRAARRGQPLVAGADDGAEARRVDRQPAAGLRRVEQRPRAVVLGGGDDRVEVGDLAGAHLHGAERDDVGARRRSRSASRAGGTVLTVTPRRSLDEKAKQRRGELDVGRDDAWPRRAARRRSARRRPRRSRRPPPARAPTPTICAHAARAPSVLSPQCSQLVRPPRQSASAACIASKPSRGGRP